MRDAAAQIAGAVNGRATSARIEQLVGDAAEAQSEARPSVPSTVAAKAPLLAAAGATAGAAHALTLRGGPPWPERSWRACSRRSDRWQTPSGWVCPAGRSRWTNCGRR